ncbi:MAG: FMN-binding glutamate synthase family protein [Pseudomonadales bacterium]
MPESIVFEVLVWSTLMLGAALLFILVVASLGALYMYVVDQHQTRNSIRRNYPLLGRSRNLLETLGTFLRQYFFAMDREELPFNRAQRSWVYRAAKDIDNTVAFGSTRQLRSVGSVMFLNTPYPHLDEEVASTDPLQLGPYADQPYDAQQLFNVSAMSYGAISRPAVRALSRGAARAGCWLNTGEGGLSTYHLEGNADLVFQIGTAKYGVRSRDGDLSEEKLKEVAAHGQVKMFELKLSQGAKPGKGGILPAEKVTEEIAAIRGIEAGKASISPNRHPEIESETDLLDMLGRIRDVTGKPCGFKLAVGTTAWLDALCEEIHRRGVEHAPDFITVDSGDGGSGAAPMALMDNVGLLLAESLPLVVDKLVEAGLRDRIRVVASGKLVTPTEVATALCLGADFTVSARGFMFALGCIQAMRCNLNTCPTGVTTHDPKLQRGLVVADKAQRVANYQKNVVKAVEMIAHSCGLAEPREFRRRHVRMMTERGLSVPLTALYPEAQPFGVTHVSRTER